MRGRWTSSSSAPSSGFSATRSPRTITPLRAVRMAEQMQHAFAALLTRWRAEGFKPFGLGIGINTGYVTVGHIGSSNRTDYTAIGKNVVVAADAGGHGRARADPDWPADRDQGQGRPSPRNSSPRATSARSRSRSTRSVATRVPAPACSVGGRDGPGRARPVRGSCRSRRSPAAPSVSGRDAPVADWAGPSRTMTRPARSPTTASSRSWAKAAMGEVYRAQDLRLDRTVALKILHAFEAGR